MKKIILTKNYGYEWFQENNIYFKGYFILKNKIYKKQDAIKKLAEIKNENELNDLLNEINGVFAFIINNDSNTFCAVDIARSIPLYFSDNLNIISDSSEAIRKELNIEKTNIDVNGLIELFIKQNVFNNNTVYSKIKTLDAAQYMIITDKLKIQNYYNHYCKIKKRTEKKALEDWKKAIDATFSNLLLAVENRQIVLSLSGGYDSRFIACMLKEKGIENVCCYTYGKKDSFEVKESKKVANNLGYKWINVEYTNDMIKNLINEEDYFNVNNEHDYTIYLQNFLAVKELKKKKFCDENAVFVTGLCADMPTGYYIKNLNEINCSEDDLVNDLYNYYYTRRELKKEKEIHFKNDILNDIRNINLPIKNKQNYIQVKDVLATKYEHSRKFLNMNRAHEFFEHEWLLPCWDKNFLNFWYSLEMKYRLKQNFYENYLLNYLFNKYNVDDKKTIATHSKNIYVTRLKYFIGGIITKIIYPLGIPLKRKVDFNNFAPLEIILYKKIKNKGMINYKRASLIQLLIIYICEQRYGEKNVKKIGKYMKKEKLQ